MTPNRSTPLGTHDDSVRQSWTPLLDALPQGVMLVDAGGRNLEVNPAAAEILGLDRETLLSLSLPEPWSNLSTTDGTELADEESPGLMALRTGMPVRGKTLGWCREDGRTIWLKVSAEPLRYGGALISFDDITAMILAHKDLQISEERHRFLADNAIDVIWTMDLQGRFTYMSPSVERLRGYTPAEVMAKPLFEMLPPSYVAATREAFKSSIDRVTSGQPLPEFRGEFELQRKDGTPVWTEVTVTSMFDKAGKFIEFLGVTRNIDDRKRMEAVVRETKANLAALIESTDDLIGSVDLDLRLVTFNSALDSHFRNSYGTEAQVGALSVDQLPPDRAGQWPALYRRALSEGPFHEEYTLPDGRILDLSFNQVHRGEEIVGISVFGKNITGRRQVEAELMQTKVLIESIVDSTPDMIWSVDHEQFRLLSFNYSLAEYFNLMRGIKIRIGMPQDELFPPGKARDQWYEFYRRALNGGYFSADYTVSAGTNVLNLNFNLLKQDGRVFGISVSGRDVTAQRKAQEEVIRLNLNLEQRVKDRTAQLEAMNQELEAFSYSVSHDLRSPLQIVNGFSEALFEDYQEKLDEGAKKYLTRIRGGVHRMGQLIEDLLKLSQISRSEINFAPIDFSDLCRKVLDSLILTHPTRRVEVSLQPGIEIQADRRLILIALENLLGNAWKYTSKCQEPRIDIGIMVSAVDERTLFIRDNGVGFDMAHADKLFNSFQRLHAASEFEGTGIGLAIVQRVIHRHGGKVWAEAEVGKGATFFFTLLDRAKL